MEHLLKNYAGTLQKMLEQVNPAEVQAAVDLIWNAYLNGKTIYVIGNGGSASNASHIACDLSKSTASPHTPRLKVVSLTDNVASITAIANDYSYEDIFTEQLKYQCQAGDVLLALSVSGTSPNVVKAVKWAARQGHPTIAWVGRNGGELYQIADAPVLFPDERYGPVEDGHMALTHVLVEYFTIKIASQ